MTLNRAYGKRSGNNKWFVFFFIFHKSGDDKMSRGLLHSSISPVMIK